MDFSSPPQKPFLLVLLPSPHAFWTLGPIDAWRPAKNKLSTIHTSLKNGNTRVYADLQLYIYIYGISIHIYIYICSYRQNICIQKHLSIINWAVFFFAFKVLSLRWEASNSWGLILDAAQILQELFHLHQVCTPTICEIFFQWWQNFNLTKGLAKCCRNEA